MTIDREQARRDAEETKTAIFERTLDLSGEATAVLWINRCLALLDELEQAEQDRDETRRIAEVWRRKRDYTLETKLAAEARLAKVPALIEALRNHTEYWSDEADASLCAGCNDYTHTPDCPIAAALEAWETNP